MRKRNKKDETERQYASVSETADAMHVSTNKLREWIKSGEIEAIKPRGKIYISLQSVKDFIARYTTGKRGDQQ